MSKFEALADHFRDQIQSGVLRPGDRLPSITQLRQRFGMSQGTVRSAMLILKAEGLVQGQQGDGVFVSPADT